MENFHKRIQIYIYVLLQIDGVVREIRKRNPRAFLLSTINDRGKNGGERKRIETVSTWTRQR